MFFMDENGINYDQICNINYDGLKEGKKWAKGKAVTVYMSNSKEIIIDAEKAENFLNAILTYNAISKDYILGNVVKPQEAQQLHAFGFYRNMKF